MTLPVILSRSTNVNLVALVKKDTNSFSFFLGNQWMSHYLDSHFMHDVIWLVLSFNLSIDVAIG
jgi:hypothetical protein